MTIKTIKVSHDLFNTYYQDYYFKRYHTYYMIDDATYTRDKIDFLDGSCLFELDGQVIGGGMIKPQLMCDVFAVDEKDLQTVFDHATRYLRELSEPSKEILVQEVIEEHLKYLDYKVMADQGYWMIRKTEVMNYSSAYLKSLSYDLLDEAADVIHKSYSHNPAFKDPPSLDELKSQIKTRLDEDDDVIKRANQVLILDNKLVGLVLLMAFEGLPLITQIAVDPSYQGRGLGRMLLNHALSTCAESFDQIRLYCFKDNPALHLYENLGFRKYGTLNSVLLKEAE